MFICCIDIGLKRPNPIILWLNIKYVWGAYLNIRDDASSPNFNLKNRPTQYQDSRSTNTSTNYKIGTKWFHISRDSFKLDTNSHIFSYSVPEQCYFDSTQAMTIVQKYIKCSFYGEEYGIWYDDKLHVHSNRKNDPSFLI